MRPQRKRLVLFIGGLSVFTILYQVPILAMIATMLGLAVFDGLVWKERFSLHSLALFNGRFCDEFYHDVFQV